VSSACLLKDFSLLRYRRPLLWCKNTSLNKKLLAFKTKNIDRLFISVNFVMIRWQPPVEEKRSAIPKSMFANESKGEAQADVD